MNDIQTDDTMHGRDDPARTSGQSYWVDATTWACPRHIPLAKYGERQVWCVYWPCPNRRPGENVRTGEAEARPKKTTARDAVSSELRVFTNGPSPTEKRRGATTAVVCDTCGTSLWRRAKDVQARKTFFCPAHRVP